MLSTQILKSIAVPTFIEAVAAARNEEDESEADSSDEIG